MTKKLDDVLEKLPGKRRESIKQRAKDLRAEYLTLRELREAQKLTQRELAKKLNVSQENISNLEKRTDLLVSTLRNHIEAMGGKLDITVKFPNQRTLHLHGIGGNSLSDGG